VLTNRATAGGAEILAAAVLDNKRGQVVGERTYGDAAVRKAITMDDGAAVILSVAKYYSPEGKAIQDNLVTPSTLVAEFEAAVDFDDNGEPIPPAVDEPQKKTESDPIVKKALEVLK
jgi:carboxyl-terminal processing protease